MKFFVYKNKTNFKEYSLRLIEKLLADNIVDDVSCADYTLVSICDITEIQDVIKAKKLGKPVITGGLISDIPIVNELSDYAWHGEIYGFRDCVKKGMHPDDMISMTSKRKKILRIDQEIKWNENPIIKVGGRAMYYYVAKGCPVRCKYCYMGNARDYQTIPEPLYNKALKLCGKNLMPIAAYNPFGVPDGAHVGETLLKKYNKGFGANGARLVRSGVEFCVKENSVSLAKGVDVNDVNEAIRRSKKEKTKMILYFIAGIETQEDTEAFFEAIDRDYNSTPSITIVFTYFAPQHYTPMHDYDMSTRKTIDAKKIYKLASSINKRVRVMPLASPDRSLQRAFAERCISIDDFNFVGKIKKLGYGEQIDACIKYGRRHLVGLADIDTIRSRSRAATKPSYWEAAL